MEKVKGYRKQTAIETPKTVKDLTVLGNQIVGFENIADANKLPYWVAFGKAGYRIISLKTDYNQNNLVADLRESGCVLADSTIKHTLRAGKLLGDSDTRHFPEGINTHEVIKLMSVFGKIKPYQWTPAYKIFKAEKLDTNGLLARFGIVAPKKTEDKAAKPELNEEHKNKYLQTVCKRLLEEKIELHKVIAELEKTYGLCIVSSRTNPEDTAKDKVKADLEKRTAQWLNGKTVQTIKDPLSGATVILDYQEESELPVQIEKALEESKARDTKRAIEKTELEAKKAKSKGKPGLNLAPAHKTEVWKNEEKVAV